MPLNRGSKKECCVELGGVRNNAALCYQIKDDRIHNA